MYLYFIHYEVNYVGCTRASVIQAAAAADDMMK